jgi:hypothetical protein
MTYSKPRFWAVVFGISSFPGLNEHFGIRKNLGHLSVGVDVDQQQIARLFARYAKRDFRADADRLIRAHLQRHVRCVWNVGWSNISIGRVLRDLDHTRDRWIRQRDRG